MAAPIVLIANPRAGRDRAGRELPMLIDALDEAGADYEIRATSHRGHATDLASEAAGAGAHTVVAVGGDGTVNEVVNGLMLASSEERPRLGVVAAGSGADFARTFGLPPHVDSSLRGILGEPVPIDIGKIEFSDGSVRYFANIANVGIAASTVERAERLPRRLGKARYVIALWPVLAAYDLCETMVRSGADEHTHVAANVLIANGRYAGGNMHFSPHSDPSDGSLDLQMNIGPKRQAVTLVPKIFRGTHLPSDRIVQASGNHFEIDAAETRLVEADGEVIGTTPITVTVVPHALEVVI